MPEPMDKDFLIRAANDNESITVIYKTETGKKINYASRFFEINPKKKYIIIDRPFGGKGAYRQLVRKDKITIFFITRGFRFLFHTQVLKRDTFSSGMGTDMPVLIIRLPDEIYDGERRNFFRVPMPMDPPIEARFVSYFEKSQSFDEQEAPDLEDYDMSESVTADLSGGGVSLRCGEDAGVMVGDIINIRFALHAGDDEEIRVEGLINNSRKTSEKGVFLKGIEFLPDRGDEYRNAQKKISRYVMNRQREMISLYGRK